jgi:carboxymethylenebutenolidase
MSTQRTQGAVSIAMLVVLALVLGAAGMWLYKSGRTETTRAAAAGDLDSSLRSGVTTHGEWVSIKRGSDSIRAYVAYPERKTKAPAVIVIHEIYGLTDWEPTVADRLAKEGFVAILPDLLSSRHGKSPADPDAGRKLIGELEPNRITADLDAVYAYVNGLPAVSKDLVGVIGFCWGGGQSFRYATNNPNLRAAVVAYGPAPDTAAMKRIKAPVLGIYGENDERINANLPMVTAEMQSAGKTYMSEVYPGTGHGFLKPGRQGYDTPEREKAWARILEFYRARLGK